MRAFIIPIIFLGAAAAYAADHADNSTATLQMLAFLDRLEISVLEELAARSNSTAFHQAYQQEIAALQVVDSALEYAGISTQSCNYSLPNTTSSLAALEQVILLSKAGTLLASSQSLYSVDSSILSTLAATSIVRSLQGSSLVSITGRIPERAPFIAPMTANWVHGLLAPFLSSESCPLDQAVRRTPELRMTVENETAVNLTWEAALGKDRRDPLLIGWVSWLREPIYTPITMTSRNSGVALIPSGLRGFVIMVMTNKTSDNIYDLSADSLSRPAIAEIAYNGDQTTM